MAIRKSEKKKPNYVLAVAIGVLRATLITIGISLIGCLFWWVYHSNIPEWAAAIGIFWVVILFPCISDSIWEELVLNGEDWVEDDE